VKLGADNKNKTIAAIALGVLAVIALIYMVTTTWSSGSAPSSTASAASPAAVPAAPAPAPRTAKKLGKPAPPDSLDPTLRLDLLATSEQVRYAGNGRNIFMSQADPVIEKPIKSGAAEAQAPINTYVAPTPPPPPPINLKFYGFASKPGEAKRVFLMNGEDVFVAGEGDIVNRRYKVLHIGNSSVQIQDLLSSGPPQEIPLIQA